MPVPHVVGTLMWGFKGPGGNMAFPIDLFT